MAYKYNNSGRKKRYNKFNGHSRFNSERKEYRPQIENTNIYQFDGTRYKKKDIKIVDIDGNVYTIAQGATVEWAVNNYKSLEGFAALEKSAFDIDKFQDAYNALKDSVLSLINLNKDGKIYDMTQINAHFNDAAMMCDLIKYVMDITEKDMPKVE